ncbi:MAG: type II toxin-antitoxin system HicB family antitoxin [Gemmatimonadales bacterium]|nr:type II toxin-antitoxin system HicB family antitoxin [Gemmatimonadales bacterium]
MKRFRTYSVAIVWSEEDRAYVATSPEFPGLSGVSNDSSRALADLGEALTMAFEAFEEENRPLPSPRRASEYSGQIRLRMPKALHALAVHQAEGEDVSLNTLLVSLLSRGLGKVEAESELSGKLERLLDELRAAVPGPVRSHRRAAP